MRIGSWTLADEPLATGAQGELRAAIHDDGRSGVAKIARPHAASRLSIQTERDVLRSLAEHRIGGVVRWFEDLDVDGLPGFVMSRHGSDLGRWLQAAVDAPGPATLREILEHAASLATILGAVHAVPWRDGRIVHRDVKPENVLVDEDGLALADFGGAIAVDELRAVELSLFGTPMWAPLDQILPGITIPDPTWDTFGVCVITFAAITGKRPTWQADPTPLLTPRGRQLWQAATRAATIHTAERSTAAAAFSRLRQSASAADVIDPVGRPSLVDEDRAALRDGLHRLGRLARLPDAPIERLERDLWQILSRGLSPVSHPSPPNRYRDARELAEQLRDATRRLDERPRHRPELLDGPIHEVPDIPIEPTEEHERAPRPGRLGAAMPVVLGIAVAGALYAARPAPPAPTGPPPPRVHIAAPTPFLIDRLEVTGERWARCAAAGACPENPATGPAPVAGITAREAAAFCRFEAGDLPSEAQWEAAHGPARFPWGEAPADCGRATALGCADAPTVGGRGATPAGVADLAGNVSEWVISDEGPRLRGGSLASPADELGRAGRRAPRPGGEPWAGVRCAWPAVR